MLTFKHNIFFKLSILYLIIFNQYIFSYYFNSIKLLIEFTQKYFTKGTFTKYNNHLKIFKCWLSILRIIIFIWSNKHRCSHIIHKLITYLSFNLFTFYTLNFKRWIINWDFIWCPRVFKWEFIFCLFFFIIYSICFFIVFISA